MIVADAMVIAHALVEVPERTDEVNGALEKDATWTSPPLWRSELRNVLLKYVRATSEEISGGELTLEDALWKMRVAEPRTGLYLKPSPTWPCIRGTLLVNASPHSNVC